MSLLSPGVTLRYEMADFDVCDRYRFIVCNVDDGLTFTQTFAGEEEEDDDADDGDADPGEPARVSPDALSDGRTIAVLSQGGWLSAELEQHEVDDDVVQLGDLPPFLLSQTALRELRDGSTLLRPEWAGEGSEPTTLTLKERRTVELERDGDRIEVKALVASGDDVELTVVDDDTWPLVIERTEGDNYWKLEAIGRAEVPELGSDDDADDDDDDADELEDDEEDLPPPVPAGALHRTGPLTPDDFVALTQKLGVTGMDMDYEGTRFLLLNDQRQIVLAADYKLVLVAMPGGVLRRAHAFPRYGAEQVLAPFSADDPVDQPGGIPEGAAIAEALAARAGADLLYPDPLGPLFISLHAVEALA
jgi:hypothetical protein